MSLYGNAQIEELAGAADMTVEIDALPDEMLVQIFSSLDSVTRTLLERVCHRWRGLLRDTHSLRKCVVVDLSRLATSPTPTGFNRFETIVTRICRTIVALLHGNPQAQTLYITGKSDVAKTWLIDTKFRDSRLLHNLLPQLTSALGRRPDMCITQVILDNLALPIWDIHFFIQDHRISRTPLRHLDLRGVLVQHLTLDALVSNCSRVINGNRGYRSVNGALIFGEHENSDFFQWITLLNSGEPPLAADEELAYQERVRNPSVLQMEIATRYFGRQLSMEDCGNALPPLIKRLVLLHSP